MKNLKKPLAIAGSIFALLSIGLAFRNKRVLEKAKSSFPPLGKFCNIQGCSLHYYTEGKGPAVVLLHGEGGDMYDFYLSTLWNKLKENYQVFALDRPGSGYSSRAEWKDYGFKNQGEIIHQAIQLLGLENPLLVGYGESSGIVLSMLMEHEEEYKGAVLLDERLPSPPELNDKLASVPILGNIFLWTLSPVIAERKVLSATNELPHNYKEKLRLTSKPMNLLSNAENKKFMQVEELEKLSSYHSNISKPVSVLHKESEANKNLISSLKLEEIIPELKIISVSDVSEPISFIGSEQVYEEVSWLLK